MSDAEHTQALYRNVRGLNDENEKLRKKLRVAFEALEIIAGKRQCLDNLMGNRDVAEEALSRMASD